MNKLLSCVAIVGLIISPLRAQTVAPVKLTPHTGFNNPIGIDHHEPTNKVVISVNYPTGEPHNFELVDVFGNRQPFSNIRGLTEEVKIATARDDGGRTTGGGKSFGGFTPGELFTGTGVAGHIARISADGSTIQNPWVVLPGETGLLRGSLHIDRTGVFGGDLIVVTTTGNVWRVTSAGVPTKLASLGTHLEGVTTAPNNPAKYGPWAGKILAGAEQQGRIYTVDAQGNTAFFSLGIKAEDIDIIPANENFFGIDFSGRTLWTAPPSEFADKVGDVLIAQEDGGQLFHVRWNGTQFQVTQVAQVTQWEHVTFSTSAIDTCRDKTPPGCTINVGYKSVTGAIFDNESGLAKIEPLFLFNATLRLDPFTPGDKSVNYRLDAIDRDLYIGFDLKITDLCGNTHICDPVFFQLEADRKAQPFNVTFRSVDRYLKLANHGLTQIRVDLNGNPFSLLSNSASAAQDLNAYHLPANGEVTIDLKKYLRDGENHIRFEIDGPAGANADMLLIDEAHQIDYVLELLPLPAEYQLSQNYPNPFNPTTMIRFSVPAQAANGAVVQLRIYNMLGELVQTLVDERMFPGNYAITWNGRNLRGQTVAAGIYVYQLITEGFKQTKRMVILR